ncbi:hypothetical protein BDA96_01G492100 [Sorghum bicolor]|uniref:Uncharacterized protein n=1 Tax=Sorghum bicolor TaxID=4558 RepID=A0A921S833_SORBI|nr:hypothetical protein BDA96_01G492100 [Sorghum bicolor]
METKMCIFDAPVACRFMMNKQFSLFKSFPFVLQC